jgi:hypothetical protein
VRRPAELAAKFPQADREFPIFLDYADDVYAPSPSGRTSSRGHVDRRQAAREQAADTSRTRS